MQQFSNLCKHVFEDLLAITKFVVFFLNMINLFNSSLALSNAAQALQRIATYICQTVYMYLSQVTFACVDFLLFLACFLGLQLVWFEMVVVGFLILRLSMGL